MKTIRILLRPPTCWAWAVVAVGAPPVAWLLATSGFGLTTRSLPVDLLVLAAWSIGEEIVFRGGLQPWLAARLDGGASTPVATQAAVPTRSNLATSAVFAALHLWRQGALALAIFPLSLVFGFLRERTGKVWPSAALHLYCNVVLYAASAVSTR